MIGGKHPESEGNLGTFAGGGHIKLKVNILQFWNKTQKLFFDTLTNIDKTKYHPLLLLQV